MNIEQVAIADVKPNPRNSRTHTDVQIDQIAASLKEFGWTNPILVDDDMTIVAGHARRQAAERLGYSDVPVIRLSGLTKDQLRAYVIADNQLATRSGWDHDILAEELAELADSDFQIDLVGFEEWELEQYLQPATIDESAIASNPKNLRTLSFVVRESDYERLAAAIQSVLDDHPEYVEYPSKLGAVIMHLIDHGL